MATKKPLACLLLVGCSPAATPHHVQARAPQVAGGTVAVFRRLSTGIALGETTATTYTLTRDREDACVLCDHRATLVVTTRRARPGATGLTWHDVDTVTFEGMVRTSEDVVRLELRHGLLQTHLVCTHDQVGVATAGAVRVRTPGVPNDVGDAGMWSPAATTRVNALVCRDALDDHAIATQLTFGDVPGIEYAWINDDMVIQGGDLRSVPPDGSVAPVDGTRMR